MSEKKAAGRPSMTRRASVSVPNFEIGAGTSTVRKSTARKSMPPGEALSEVGKAVPLLGGKGVIETLSDWVTRRSKVALGSEAATKPAKVSIMSLLLSYSTRQENFLMAFGLIVSGFAGLCLPAWLALLAKSLDTFSNLANISNAGGDVVEILQRELDRLVWGFVILGAFSLFVGFGYVAIWTYTGEKQSLRIKEKYVKASLKQDAEWFDLNNRDELPTEIANAMIHISGAVGRQTADLFSNFVSAAGSLAVAFLLNAPLALVMLCVVPFIGIIIMIFSCFLRKKSREAGECFVSAGAHATQVISGIKTVASLCAERWALTMYNGRITEGQKKNVNTGVLTGLMSGVTGLLFYATYSIAFTVGTHQVANNSGMTTVIGCFFNDDPNDPDCSVTGASVMCCIYGVILCATFFGLMAPGLQAVNLGRQAAVKVFATIDRVPDIDASSPDGKVLDDIRGEIEFRNVFFAYPSRPKQPIFTNFNLTIAPGSSVAFCGPSGSGKSTIAKLLLRFYDPPAGCVLVDGEEVDGLNVSYWRKQIGYVSQQPIIFPGSIRYNIACGKEGATDEEVIAAAKAACAHEFIKELPDGYDTFYSGASVQLSGGQLQRICIARAIIRSPPILLLDEATSALDTNSERQVQSALENIRKLKQTTTVAVAHRLSTIVGYDQIAVLSDGVIAELGSHKSLIVAGGIYSELCEAQGITPESTFDSEPTTEFKEGASSISYQDITEQPQDIETGLIKENDENDDDKDHQEGTSADSRRLTLLNKPEWGYLFMGVVGAGIVGALPPCEAILTARIVFNFYDAEPDKMVEANKTEILAFLGFGAASLIGHLLSACGFSVSGYRLTGRLRSLVFESIIRRSMGWFDVPEHSVGELTTRLEADAEAVAKVSGWSLGYRVRVFASLVTGISIALAFSWQVGLTTIACVPMIMGAAIVQKLCLSKRYVSEQEGLSPETIFEQGLRGIEAVQSYDLQEHVGDEYSKALAPQSKSKIKTGVVAGLVYGLSQFAVFGTFGIVFYVSSVLLTSGKVDFLSFFTALLAVMFGALAIAQVSADFNARQDGLAAANRVFTVIDEPLDSTDPFSTDGDVPASLKGGIEFESCSFSYPTRPGHPIFYPWKDKDGFSLSINQKKSVAFVGRSGCGKSTALQILLRFYDVSSGEVTVDDNNILGLNIRWLRQQIGYVGQMPCLFAGTVRENILLGKPDATQGEIETAAKAANAHEFIQGFSNGYDTDIGGGSLLSGGQAQRIAIARAIVQDPPILVLDEATAALDNVSEKIVQTALDEMQRMKPRTTLTVAHRLTTVQNCDTIAVLGDGGVKEVGSHSDLLEQNGLYRELWEKQGAKSKDD